MRRPRLEGPSTELRTGFTVIEVLIAASLLAGVLSITHFAIFGGGRSYALARARLDVLSSCRAALEHVQNDVRRAVTAVEVSDTGAELTVRILKPGPGGLPALAQDGKLDEAEVRYKFDATSKRLLRVQGSEETVVGRDLPDVVFSQKVFEVRGLKIPSVSAEITAILDGRPFRIRSTAVPRVMAGWAANPGWVFVAVGSPYEFKVEQ